MYWVQFHFQGISVSLTTIRYHEIDNTIKESFRNQGK